MKKKVIFFIKKYKKIILNIYLLLKIIKKINFFENERNKKQIRKGIFT